MEARNIFARQTRFSFVIAFCSLVFVSTQTATAQFRGLRGRTHQVQTQHFVVTAEDPKLAERVAREAERYRKELAIEWLGKELGSWQEKCPITVELGMHAGGETSFAFITNGSGRGTPTSWQMKIFGPPDRLLDAVLPHEITHTIFATHFGRPLPRWADEGACTTVEHETERAKNHRMLIDFLKARPSRGIPFNRMFTMKNYPHDILPLYAQGYSLAKFLIMKKGRRHFLDYVGAGMAAESRMRPLRAWDSVTDRFYGYDDLSELQIAWETWVRGGSRLEVQTPIAGSEISIPKPSSNARLARLNQNTPSQTFASDRNDGSEQSQIQEQFSTNTKGSWYARGTKKQEGATLDRMASLPNARQDRGSNSDSIGSFYSLKKVPESSNPSDDPHLNQYDYAPRTLWR